MTIQSGSTLRFGSSNIALGCEFMPAFHSYTCFVCVCVCVCVCACGVCLDAEKAEESGEEKRECVFCRKMSEWNFDLIGMVSDL